MTTDVVRIIASDSGRHRVEIARRPASGFMVEVFRWTEEWVVDYGKIAEFWEQVNQGVTITVTLERAEELAAE